METRFEQLEIENGFVLSQVEAINYLDWLARTHADQIMQGEEVIENITELFDDLKQMKDDILKYNWEWVEFSDCPASVSGIDIRNLIKRTELDYAIEDLAEWVMNNCDLSESVPLIFKDNREQKQLEKYIKEMQEK